MRTDISLKPEKKPAKIAKRVVCGWVYDWLELNKFPEFVKGRYVADAIFLAHPGAVGRIKTPHGMATVIGYCMFPEILGYEKHARTRSGWTYRRVKVISRDEFNRNLVSV